MAKLEISLSTSAVNVLNEILTAGKKAEVDVNGKTGELMIFEVPKSKLKYKVAVTAR